MIVGYDGELMETADIQIDEERCEAIYQEMLAEALEKYQYSGMALLLFKIKLREAVWEGARRWEEKVAKGLV